jgi:hypothetical protein
MIKTILFVLFLSFSLKAEEGFKFVSSNFDTSKCDALKDFSEFEQVENFDEESRKCYLDELLRVHNLTPSKRCGNQDFLNFGVLVNNRIFKIYRSGGLGKTGLEQLEKHLTKKRLPLPKTIIYMNRYGYGAENRLITGVLKLVKRKNFYRHKFAAEQVENNMFPLSGKKYKFIHPAETPEIYLHGRDPYNTEKEIKIKYKGVTQRTRGSEESLYNITYALLKSDGPVDFHCKGGIHRTGMIGLTVRYLQGGAWTKDFPFPIELPVKSGHSIIMAQIGNLAEYDYYLHNTHNYRPENLEAIRKFTQEDEFNCIKNVVGPYISLVSTGGTCAGPGLVGMTEDEAKAIRNKIQMGLDSCAGN